VNKIIFEGYLLANLHIIWLLDEDKELPPVNQKFFQNVLAQVSVFQKRKEMPCKDEELVTTFENHYKTLRPMDYKPGYRDYINTILNNGCAVDMETATKNHLSLSFYKWCSKYIQKLHPELSKGEVYEVMKGIYEEKYSVDNPIVLEFRKLLGDQAPTAKAIEKNPTNVLKVYRKVLQYYKAYEEKKTPGNTEFHQGKEKRRRKYVCRREDRLKQIKEGG
jgi:hypothetical protein